MSQHKLFDAQTTNANGVAVSQVDIGQRDVAVIVRGTPDGCTIKIQMSDDNVTFVDLTNGTFTAAGSGRLFIGEGMFIRAVLSSAGAGTTMTVVVG